MRQRTARTVRREPLRGVPVESDALRGYRREGVEFYPRGRFIATTLERFAL